MFFPGSRYAKLVPYQVTLLDGTTVSCIRSYLPEPRGLQGLHRRLDGQRPDLIAAHFLSDATAFWRLCDASGAVAPDALAARDLVAIPIKEP
jgi:hypothetical protein